ncbi:MAG: XdhC family protein [Clostridiales bacterium]|nr:XdhC family protein [Clostridiales bacterium]
MGKLYKLLDENISSRQNVVITLLDEDGDEEKALVSEGKMVWNSDKQGFLEAHKTELSQISTSGIRELAGEKIYCEVVGHEKNLVICGGGNISIPVIQIGKMLGFKTIVLEDRPKYADNARRAGADRVYCEVFEKSLDKIDGNQDTFFIIVTRGHRYDQICLEKIAAKEHAYIGMIGSRRRTAIVKNALAEKGVDRQVLDDVYTPIGLDINAETPAEIAVAIMAEIIKVKNQKTKDGEYSKELMHAILDEKENPEDKILVTIINRQGSAPREVGTKMLVKKDGTCIGTIGGGCVESEVFEKARRMLLIPTGGKIKFCHVDMTADSAADEGMVCGGSIDVMMEVIQS